MNRGLFKWLVQIAVWLVAVTTSANLLAFAPILGDIAKDLAISIPTAQGSLLGIFVFVVAVSILVSGALADKFGAMPILIIASIVGLVPNLLYPFFGDIFGFVVVCRIFQGFGAGAVFSLLPLLATHWFPENERGRAIGLGTSAVGLGMTVGVVGSPLIYQIAGNWRATMSWFGLAGVLVLFYSLYIAYNYKTYEPMAPLSDSTTDTGWESVKDALHKPTTYIGIFMCFFSSWLLNALNDLTPQYFALDAPIGVGFGRVMAGKIMIAVQLGYILGGVVAGFLIDKIFKGEPKPVLLLGYLVPAVLVYPILLPAVYNNVPLLMVLLFLAGLGLNFLNPSAAVFIAKAYPEKIVGRVVGMWLGIGAFGGAAGIIVSATALHATGTFRLTITLFSIVCIVGFILSRLLKTNITDTLPANAADHKG